MEFIAIRENLKRDEMLATMPPIVMRQHVGQSFGAAIPAVITPNSSATRLRAAAQSSPATSIIPKASR